ncbi:MAG: hypothetical protein KDA65_17285 [Planctomycetaceae bacterium]|nr:hypothetical protein [Planctomycetaceae bacterium]
MKTSLLTLAAVVLSLSVFTGAAEAKDKFSFSLGNGGASFGNDDMNFSLGNGGMSFSNNQGRFGRGPSRWNQPSRPSRFYPAGRQEMPNYYNNPRNMYANPYYNAPPQFPQYGGGQYGREMPCDSYGCDGPQCDGPQCDQGWGFGF